jgi:hypothetical protein
MDEYLWPILGVWVSFLCGMLSYACRFAERNRLFGVMTPYSTRNDANWREVNDRCCRMVPPISGAAAVLAGCGLVAAVNVGALLIAAFRRRR